MHIIVVTACQLIVLCGIVTAGLRPYYSPLPRASYSAPREDYSLYNNLKSEYRRHAQSMEFPSYLVENYNVPNDHPYFTAFDVDPSVFANRFFRPVYGPRSTTRNYAYNRYMVPAQTNEYQRPYGPVQELSNQLTTNIFPIFRGLPEYRSSNVAEPPVLQCTSTMKNFAEESRPLKRKEPVNSEKGPVFLVKIYHETPATEETPAETETTTVVDNNESEPETTVGHADDTLWSGTASEETDFEKDDEEETSPETETTTVADIAPEPETTVGSVEGVPEQFRYLLKDIDKWRSLYKQLSIDADRRNRFSSTTENQLESDEHAENLYDKPIPTEEIPAETETTTVADIVSDLEKTVVSDEFSDENPYDKPIPREETPAETETSTVADIVSDFEKTVGSNEFSDENPYDKPTPTEETPAETETSTVADIVVSDLEATVGSYEFSSLL